MRYPASKDDGTAREDTRGILYRAERSQDVLHLSRANHKSNERSKRMRDRYYIWGLVLTVLGGASLADHITYGVDRFPISAVVFGLGFVLIVKSYVKDK